MRCGWAREAAIGREDLDACWKAWILLVNVGPYTAVILLTVETRFLDDIFGDSGGIKE